MVKLLAILARARALHGALSSETTRRQWWVTFPVAVAVAAAGYFLPPIAGEEVALALSTVLIAALAPLVSRAIGYQDKTDLPYAEVFIIAVMRRRERVWRAFSGTLMDARAEGYDCARDADGNLYDVQSGQCEGVVMRDAVASIRELQGAGGTDNAPLGLVSGDIEICADNTDREER